MNVESTTHCPEHLRTLAANLRQIRRNKGVSVLKAAKATATPLRLLWKLENGLSSGFSFLVVERLRVYYGVSYEEVFSGM